VEREDFERLVEELLERETLEAAEVERVLENVPKWEALTNGARTRPIRARRLRIAHSAD
jgi:hypothetical protein